MGPRAIFDNNEGALCSRPDCWIVGRELTPAPINCTEDTTAALAISWWARAAREPASWRWPRQVAGGVAISAQVRAIWAFPHQSAQARCAPKGLGRVRNRPNGRAAADQPGHRKLNNIDAHYQRARIQADRLGRLAANPIGGKTSNHNGRPLTRPGRGWSRGSGGARGF